MQVSSLRQGEILVFFEGDYRFLWFFFSDFPLTYCWVGLKLFGHPAVEFFDKGWAFLGELIEI